MASGPECPHVPDCMKSRERLQQLEVNHATLREQAKNIEECTERIENTVREMSTSIQGTVKELYAKYGEVKSAIHSEETSRMTADRNIETKMEEKTDQRGSRLVTWALTVLAIGISVMAMVFK